MGSSSWFIGLGRPANVPSAWRHIALATVDRLPQQNTADVTKPVGIHIFTFFCFCLSLIRLSLSQLVGKQLRFKLKKELLSLHHVASGCYPVVSLSLLNFWDMLKFTLVSKTHKINQTDWIKFHLPPPAGWCNTVVSRLKPTLSYVTSKDFPGVP